MQFRVREWFTGSRIQVNGGFLDEALEIIRVPARDFPSELQAFLIGCGAEEIDGEVTDHGHVFGAVSFSDTG